MLNYPFEKKMEFFELFFGAGKARFELLSVEFRHRIGLSSYSTIVKNLDAAPIGAEFFLLMNGHEGFMTDMKA